MRLKYGCDMRGLLSFQILWLLSRKPLHGEGIAEEIAQRRGEKPKAGTLYPALRELREDGLISGSKEGKTVVYTLTRSGRASLKLAIGYFCRSFGDVLEEGALAPSRQRG